MYVVCSDLEGVFVPEVWINVSKKTGIEELKLTTRDINDYDVLMTKRLSVLKKHGLTLKDIQDVIATIEPFPGAMDFIEWIKSRTQLIIVSDTFREFADPLMKQLNRPTLFCHSLTTDENKNIIDYKLRQKDPKRKVVQALRSLKYKVVAFGDSYNDVTMLEESDKGILFCPPQNVIDDYPEFDITRTYEELKEILEKYI
ncbi:MAG: bifunctional phosphoserine phosphatase/homoserine phosphotransferase ThrH [Bacteroidales bacterium]